MAGTITHEWNGTTLIITSDSGTSSCDLKGAPGDMGIRGAQGEKGDTGAKGDTGERGVQGEKGESGNILVAFPIGSIYMSTVSTNPGSFIGGTWTQLKDRFLLAAGDTYGAGNTGGKATHTIIDKNLPLESICVSTNTSGSAKYNGGATWTLKNWANGDYIVTTRSIASTTMNSALESAVPISNMPPYQVVYMWQRIE